MQKEYQGPSSLGTDTEEEACMNAQHRFEEIVAGMEQMVSQASPALIPLLIGAFARLQARMQMRLIHREPEPARQQDRLLKIAEASGMLGMTEDYLYRHADDFPFSVRISPKQLRFSLNGIERYIKQRRSM